MRIFRSSEFFLRRLAPFTVSTGALLFVLSASLRADTENTAYGNGALPVKGGSADTAIGFDALNNNSTGRDNTAVGEAALVANTTGYSNTGIGAEALYSNTTGLANTGTGVTALYNNTTGNSNLADGVNALYNNTTGSSNTATGANALYHNTTGGSNTATGVQALYSNAAGQFNTADGVQALYVVTGSGNTGTGYHALYHDTTGNENTALGGGALLSNTTGAYNLGVGYNAGSNLDSGEYNIDIGANVVGASMETNTIRIGLQGTQTHTIIAGISGATASGGSAVFVAADGTLGTMTSSGRFKDDIRDMAGASSPLLALRPVTFRYKPELDPAGLPQFGLVAEEVEKIDPALVVHDADGKPYSVRYEQVNAMLLNEFLKEHAAVQAQAAAVSKLEAANVEQAKLLASQREEFQAAMAQIKELTADMKAQAALLQRVSAQVEVSGPDARLSADNGR